jgi:D-sedoheptulose 7-phosphate isomerase
VPRYLPRTSDCGDWILWAILNVADDSQQTPEVAQNLRSKVPGCRWLFIIGNGGSGANASHLCEDLAKCTLRDFESQKRLKVLSLTDNTSAIMAWGNDEGYDRIFVEQLKNFASPGDLVLAISGSGNSPNILKAVSWANKNGLTTLGITGFSGGQLKSLAHHNFHVDIDDMGMVESLHSVVFHWVIDDLHRRFTEKLGIPVELAAGVR